MNESFKIQIADGIHKNSPRCNFLKEKSQQLNNLPVKKYAQLNFVEIDNGKLSQHAVILDTGKLVDFSVEETTLYHNKKVLNVKTYSCKSGRLFEDEKRCLLFKKEKDSHNFFLFSSDLDYCIILQLENSLSLGNVIKSTVRITLCCHKKTAKSQNSSPSYYQEYLQAPIRSKKKVMTIEACLTTSSILAILLNFEENQHHKMLKMMSVIDISDNNACFGFIKDVKVSPVLTYVRKLSSSQIGDKFIVEDAKSFCVYSSKPGYHNKVEPFFKNTNPHITFNVYLDKELLLHDFPNGSRVDIYEIKEISLDDEKKLEYNLIWKVKADELGLHRVHIFNVKSFKETLIYYNQTHSIKIFNPFRKKILHQLDLDQENLNMSCQSCIANWSCEEVYVRLFDHGKKRFIIQVFSMTPTFCISLFEQSAEKVLETYSILMLEQTSLPRIFRKRLGYF